jgi:hypothetical protein
VARVVGFIRQHARCSPTIGAKSTRPVPFWTAVLAECLNLPGLTDADVRAAFALDARIAIADDGRTNVRAGATLRAGGFGGGK